MDVLRPNLLILETSGRVGQVALASGFTLLGSRDLQESRRHARDLAPAVQQLLALAGWTARDVQGVLVSRGPGSYTGLRVGIMSAKTFAYVTGCPVLAVDTFAVLAHQAPGEADLIEVIADAQQDKVYVQCFRRSGAGFRAETPLEIRACADWLQSRPGESWITGPGLRLHAGRLPAGSHVVDPARWDPQPGTLLEVGLERWQRGERNDHWTLEPLYLRPSSAEEKWQKRSSSV